MENQLAEAPISGLSFSTALIELKQGRKVTREAWGGKVALKAQYPDENSKMTLPYLYMEKIANGEVGDLPKTNLFPCDLSCESIFAEDWKIVE